LTSTSPATPSNQPSPHASSHASGAGEAAGFVSVIGAAPAGAFVAGREPPSVLILALDDEANIAACIDAASFSDDVVVLDGGSKDRTAEIAASRPNVRVVKRPFDSRAAQAKFGLERIQFRRAWVLICDADERVTPELSDEVITVVNRTGAGQAAYRVRTREFFLGRSIERSVGAPARVIRLVRPELVRFENDSPDGSPTVRGPIGDLDAPCDRHAMNAGLKRWFEKLNADSDREAELIAARIKAGGGGEGAVVRRGRPIGRFLSRYILGGGFLEGVAGLRYCAMSSMYEYWLNVKINELVRSWREGTEAVVRQRLAAAPPGGTAAPAAGTGGDTRPRIDVMIPTYNEAAHATEVVVNSLESGEVFVLDSLSNDGTQKLSRDAGATVVEHPFENYSRQKNWGLDNLPMKGDWVFILDADERITPELREELFRVARDPGAHPGYFVNRVVIFMGWEIRHGGFYPSWNLRFFKRGSCRYEDRAVHEHMLCDGETGHLEHEMLHIRRESISQFIRKHIKYAEMESNEWVKQRRGTGAAAKGRSLFMGLAGYRHWLRRELWPRLPLRHVIRFLYMYVYRLGVLDRRAGWHLACLIGTYEYMITLLYHDKLRQAESGAAKH